MNDTALIELLTRVGSCIIAVDGPLVVFDAEMKPGDDSPELPSWPNGIPWEIFSGESDESATS